MMSLILYVIERAFALFDLILLYKRSLYIFLLQVPLPSLDLFLFEVEIVRLVLRALAVPDGVVPEPVPLLLIEILNHLSLALLLHVIYDFELRILTDDESLRGLHFFRDLDSVEEVFLEVRRNLFHQFLELVWDMVTLFGFKVLIVRLLFLFDEFIQENFLFIYLFNLIFRTSLLSSHLLLINY